MDEELESTFSRLLGRQASIEEVRALERVRDVLGLRKNDAIWLIIMALQYYQAEYEKIPGMISDCGRDIQKIGEDIVNRLNEVAEKITQEIERGVKKRKIEVKKEKVSDVKVLLVWGVWGMALLLFVFASFSFLFYKSGYDAGYKKAYFQYVNSCKK